MTETKSLCRFFNYSNIVTYLGKMEEYVTVESASGDFIMYITNTGETCWISDHADIDTLHKAEAHLVIFILKHILVISTLFKS